MVDGGQREAVLRFNPNNETTVVVERVATATGSAVRKQLRAAAAEPSGPAYWVPSSAVATHWNYWRREVEVYRDRDLRASMRGTGLDLPGARVVEDEHGATLWLEDVGGTAGPDFTLADHVATAAALGRWQGRSMPQRPWASRGFLREYATSRPADLCLVDDDAAWDQPLVRENWPAGLRQGWARLLGARHELFAAMDALPRTVCHLDAWVSNAIRRPDGTVVLVDWAFAGDGAVGEDLGNWLPDAVFDLFWPAERLGELEAACFPAYLQGLREAGWEGSDAQARLGVSASCVKYIWLLPLLLAQASRSEHHAYHRSAEPAHLYRQRGLALAHLVGWCDQALTILGSTTPA